MQTSHWSVAILSSSWADVGGSLIRSPGPEIILQGTWLCPLASWLHPLGHPFSEKHGAYLQWSRFHSLIPVSGILGSNQLL